MDDCDWLLSVEKVCDWLRIEPGVTGNFLLGHPIETTKYMFLTIFFSHSTKWRERKKIDFQGHFYGFDYLIIPFHYNLLPHILLPSLHYLYIYYVVTIKKSIQQLPWPKVYIFFLIDTS